MLGLRDGKRTRTQQTTPAFSDDAGKHTISFIVGNDTGVGYHGFQGINLIDNVTLKRTRNRWIQCE
jgi:hypothetical protein